MDFVSEFLNGAYMPHGHCFLWRTDLLLMHVGGDVAIAAAYFAIPAALVKLVKARADLAFNWIFLMFALFIFFCGVTHVISSFNVWHGYYHVEGISKVVTAVVSVLTAIMIWRLLPSALAIPGQHELRQKNQELERLQADLQDANQDLERRVLARTLELELLASQDPLTGLSNRRNLMRQLEVELSRAHRYGHPLSLLLLDIDDFKRLNDQHGHQMGDNALRAVSRVLLSESRAADTTGRYGGEEFLILMPETSAQEAANFARRLLDTIRSEVIAAGDQAVSLTCSIGVASARADEDPDQLVNRADQAMYRAKAEGKNTVSLLSDEDRSGQAG
ncbi:MAG: GGDEF domain-containing protein [Halioglobus sp.]|nr:GGDEF domain-containing protein [Halioglobus sp.]